MSIHCLPLRKRGGLFHLDDRVSHCEKLFHKFSADVCYHVYAPLLSHLFLCGAPKVAGLHASLVADFGGNPADFLKQGPFVAGAYALQKLFGERALASFDAVHTVNPEGLPLRHERIYAIPNWVDCSVTNDSLKAKGERGETFRVLFAGKPQYVKGFDLFVALSSMVREEDIEFVATSAPESHHDRGRVRFLGAVPHSEMPGLYSTVGLLLHPVRQETFGLVILESLASGTPVVTTPISSHIALDLPLRYASNLPEFVREIKDVYTLWKEDFDSYLELGKEGAKAVRRYDRTALLPQFENMLNKVARD